jgi:hypothetical protein
VLSDVRIGLVTGANQGLGRAVAARLAREWGAQGIVYADAVRSGAAAGQGWPEWINIPSKVGQVAAVRIYARDQRERAIGDRQLIVAVCPGLVDTRASRPWFTDMSQAQSPDQAAIDVVKLATGAIEPQWYGELVQHGRVLPWAARSDGPTPRRKAALA